MSAEINYDREITPWPFGHMPCDFEHRYNAVKRDNDRLVRQLGEQQQELDRRRRVIAGLVLHAGGHVAITYLEQDQAFDAPLDCYIDGRDDTFNVRIGRRSDPVPSTPERPGAV